MIVPGSLNSMLVGGNTGGLLIQRSLRFRAANGAYLSRTFGGAGSTTKVSVNFWVKRTTPGAANEIVNFGAVPLDSFGFLAGDTFFLNINNGISAQLVTTQLFQDPTAHTNILVAIDTTQATAANRMRVYKDGTEITSFTTANYPALNYTLTGFNAAVAALIGQVLGVNFLDGCLSEFIYVDGQQLTPSSFGATDVFGEWSPIKYLGTYGTNGFHLTFADNSNTTAATLGKDTSGNANNWTPNSFSVTPGITNDSLTETPTNYGTDTGVGGEVRGNYCTLNPLRQVRGGPINGNLSFSTTGNSALIGGTFTLSTGKWYWEFIASNLNGNNVATGWANGSGSDATTLLTGAIYYSSDGSITGGGGGSGATWVAGDTIGISVDFDAGTLNFYKNNVAQAGTLTFTPNINIPMTPLVATGAPSPQAGDVNFGQRPFTYTAPSGYRALCTQNIETPSIIKGALAFQANLRTGTGATATVAGMSFAPDMIWPKSRSAATDNNLFDTSRGVTKGIISDSASAEYTQADTLTTFNSDGYVYGADSIPKGVNVNAATYVDWCWRKGATYGFDIVLDTGTGSIHTIAHSLGAVPFQMIRKSRSAATDWIVYHIAAGNSLYLVLDSSNATVSDATAWNTTTPTSSVFTVGILAANNTNAATYVTYLWSQIPGFSAFSSYTGNGSTSGPFAACKIRPAFLMVKSTSADNWQTNDSQRSPANVNNAKQFPNLSVVENGGGNSGSTNNFNFVATGFTAVTTNTATNGNGVGIVYAAFAASPFKYARSV